MAAMRAVATRVYREVVSNLCPAGHRLDYVPCRTMSRLAVAMHRFNAKACVAGT